MRRDNPTLGTTNSDFCLDIESRLSPPPISPPRLTNLFLSWFREQELEFVRRARSYSAATANEEVASHAAISRLHAVAANRGDGLHPELLALFRRAAADASTTANAGVQEITAPSIAPSCLNQH